MPEWYSGEWKKRGFEGLWVIEGLFSAALRPSTQPITASMECSGTGGDTGDCGRHDMAAYLTAVRMITASMECSGTRLK